MVSDVCHMPVSTFNICEEVLNRESDILNGLMLIQFM